MESRALTCLGWIGENGVTTSQKIVVKHHLSCFLLIELSAAFEALLIYLPVILGVKDSIGVALITISYKCP